MRIANVELNRLRPGAKINARGEPDHKNGIGELVASIRAVGLLQPLLVREIPTNVVGPNHPEYEVVDGNRRLAALIKIKGKAGKDKLVPVLVADQTDTLAAEASLAANVVRVNLHPVDEYHAYAKLIAAGEKVEEIAKRFGVKERWVRQRLQLAALSPALREQWRAGKLSADQAEALSCVPDHARQEAAWKDARDEWAKRPDSLRKAMAREGADQKDLRVKLVGIDAYKAAGGTLSDDLFSDMQLILDHDILDRLVADRMEEKRAKYLDQGWAWVATRDEMGGDGWRRPKLDCIAYATDEERALIASDKYSAKRYAVEQALYERAAADPAARARSGVVLDISSKGEIEADLLRVKLLSEDEADDDESNSEDGPAAVSGGLPAAVSDKDGETDAPKVNWALRQRLSETLTKALSEAVKANPSIALPALVASLKMATRWGGSAFRIDARDRWMDLAPPEDPEDRGGWTIQFLAARGSTDAELKSELALLIGPLLDLRELRFDPRGAPWRDDARLLALDELASALPSTSVQFEITDAFDLADYFGRINKEDTYTALIEMGADPQRTLKKDALVAYAVGKAKEAGWLPEELRTVHYRGPRAQKEAAE